MTSKMDDTEAHDTNENQISGNDEPQQSRNNENKNASQKRNNRLKMGHAYNHGKVLLICSGNGAPGVEFRRIPLRDLGNLANTTREVLPRSAY
jgi:hypothetical protein